MWWNYRISKIFFCTRSGKSKKVPNSKTLYFKTGLYLCVYQRISDPRFTIAK